MASDSDDDFDYEAIIAKEREEKMDVTKAESLSEAFACFGASTDDVLTHREMVLINGKINHAMEAATLLHIQEGRYDEGDAVVRRLAKLKGEFKALQMADEVRRQNGEVKNYERAAKRIRNIAKRTTEARSTQVRADCMDKKRDLEKLHAWQRGQLEGRIKRMHKPPVRFSKDLLEWKSSEKHLARLQQFTDAKALSKRIAVLEPQELAAHRLSWGDKLQALREKLLRRQDFEIRKLDEKLHDLNLRSKRDGERDAKLNEQRLKNHKTDMQHAHIVDRNHLPEYCKVVDGRVKPVVKKRDHLLQTSSTYRGSQLLKSIKGKKMVDVSLCDVHDFDNEPSDTIRLID